MDAMMNFSRIFKWEKVDAPSATIIGAGSIGSNVADIFASHGMKEVTLVDYDVIEDKNIPPSQFTAAMIGRNKAVALGERYGFSAVSSRVEEWEGPEEDVDILVLSTDSLRSRKEAFLSLADFHEYIIDIRIGEANMEAWFVGPHSLDEEKERYLKSFEYKTKPAMCGAKAYPGLTKGAVLFYVSRIIWNYASGTAELFPPCSIYSFWNDIAPASVPLMQSGMIASPVEE